MSQLIKKLLRNSLVEVRHVSPTRHAEGQVDDIYARVEQEYGMLAAQIALHSPAPETLAASWMMLRETLIATGHADRTTKEAVATIVALGNSCRYCVDLHTATLDALAEARDPNADPNYDLGVRRIADWTRAARLRHAAEHHDAPFPAEQIPELVGVMVATQYLTRMANVFLPESPLPATGRDRTSALLGRFLLPTVVRTQPAGLALSFLPAAALPADLDWASGNPIIASAFARAAAAIDAAGARSVPSSVRDVVTRQLSEWDGLPPGPDPTWAVTAVAGLPVAEQPIARFALLVAMASHQVEAPMIDDVRRMSAADDQALIEIAAWASMVAARLVGGWAAAAIRHSEVEPVFSS
jgi:AhpD family alkylhydroperoxidase